MLMHVYSFDENSSYVKEVVLLYNLFTLQKKGNQK